MSATSARIPATTTCNERSAHQIRSLPDATCREPVSPRTPGRRIHPFVSRLSRHDRHIRATDEIRSDGDGRPFAWRLAALDHHRPHRLPDGGRSVRNAGDPAFACETLSGGTGRDGICGQRHDHGHGGGRARRWLFQPAYRPAARHSHQPRRAGDSDQPAGLGAQSYDLHPAADRAGPVHGVGLCFDARLSRRTMQRHGRRRRVRGLHHRKCRQQPDRPADLGRRRRHVRPRHRTSTSLRCSISPARRWSISPSSASSRCIRWGRCNRRSPR